MMGVVGIETLRNMLIERILILMSFVTFLVRH